MIPKTVYYTHENSESVKKFQDQINYSKSKNKNYKFIFYDDINCVNFIKKYFPDFYQFYIRINEGYGAAKADIFRVLILYKYGGIYIDAKTKIEDMDELFKKYPNKDFYTCSFFKDDKISHELNIIIDTKYQNFFMATQKNGKIITKIKDDMFSRLSSYGKVKLCPAMFIISKITKKFGDEKRGSFGTFTYTGPVIFTKIIKSNPDIIFDVAMADKQYVIYNSHIPNLERFLINLISPNEFKNSYHFNKLPLLKDI